MPLRKVDITARRLEDYERLVSLDLFKEIKGLASQLANLRIAHLNATAAGGGVAEVLNSLVPLTQGVGLRTDWYTLEAPEGYFEVTKKLHNLLQGSENTLTEEEKNTYLHYSREFAEEMESIQVDAWVVHDPQPLAISAFLSNEGKCLIWRSHINSSSPNQDTMEFILPFIQAYDRQIFALESYVPPALAGDMVSISPAAIDPLAPKNVKINLSEARAILARLGIDPARPLVTQVSRFDPWKDPIGVMDAYREVKQWLPDLQLALVGVFSATDDPEAPRVYAEVEAHCGGEEDIHLYKDPAQVGDREINAFQTASEVIMQKSIREGFGLTVAEAMWKGSPVIGGNTGGIREQIQEGLNGFLVDSVEEAAERILELVTQPEKRKRMGMAARETVRQRFLMPRLLRDHLQELSKCKY